MDAFVYKVKKTVKWLAKNLITKLFPDSGYPIQSYRARLHGTVVFM